MRTTRPAALTAALLFLGASAITSLAASSASAAPSAPPAAHDDFNADGYPDLVVAAPDGTVDGQQGAGYIAVMYGSAKGYSKANSTVISQATAGVPGVPEAGDAFGTAVASGDLDLDGYPDLLVGSPGEDVGTVQNAGAVTFLGGTAEGLADGGMSLEARPPVANGAYGTGLAVGYFYPNGNIQHAVLANDGIWLHGWDEDTGTVDFGTRWPIGAESPPAGASAGRDAAPEGVTFTGLTAGNFADDHYDDLVVLGEDTRSGRSEPWGWYVSGTAASPGEGRLLPAGTVGATGDVNGDGFDDLLASHPGQVDASGQDTAGGEVRVYYGGPNGLDDTDPARQDRFTQDSEGVRGTGEPGDGFGSDLSVVDADGDGRDDVAVGASGEDVEAARDAGAVWLLRGSAEGLTGTGSQLFHQDSPDVPGAAEAGDEWGAQVRLVDADHDGDAGLAAAAPGENAGSGAVWMLDGTPSGPTASGSWTFGATSLGAPSDGARFGSTLGE